MQKISSNINLISIIIPAHNAESTIGQSIEAALEQKGFDTPYEVMVVDDGSSDNTSKIAEKFGIRVIKTDNHGPAAARNLGAQAAKGDILIFLDADCVPEPDWLMNMLFPFSNPKIVGVRGVYRSSQKGLIPRFVQLEYNYKYAYMTKFTSIDFVDSYSAGYRREIFSELGGFEVLFPAPSVEDQEFSFRLSNQGFHLVFSPDAIVYHQHDRNLVEYIVRKYRIGYWKAFMLRWLPDKIYKDTHTPATQRLQILFLWLGILAAISGEFWNPARNGILLSILLFSISSIKFLSYILQNDRRVLLVAPFTVFLRAFALGLGLFVGILFPPHKRPKRIGLSPLERFIKRGMDAVFAFLALTLSAPLLLLAAIAIKLDTSGRALYVQERIGEHGMPFTMLKLRTMVEGADKRLDSVIDKNQLQGPAFKIPDDPRITRVGKILRRWSLDEIPQFWNVLIGEMSLVGPRPEETAVVEKYTTVHRKRLLFKPGMTGPMQVSGRGYLDMDERLQLDLDYIENYSLLVDIRLLLKTIPVVLSGKGAL